MRLHISLEDDLVAEVDRVAGPRGRSEYIAESVRRTLDRERRWGDFETVVGALSARGHDWDDDPAGWVREQRRTDSHRVG